MKKNYFLTRHQQFSYYKKFSNLQKRIISLIRSGDFYKLSVEIRNRLVRRLKLLYSRLMRIAGKEKLRWAGAAMALILSTSFAKAQFADPVMVSGFNAQILSSPTFADYDADGDLDIIEGDFYGRIFPVQNINGVFGRVVNPFDSIDAGQYSMPAMADIDNDGDLDLLVGNGEGTFRYYENIGEYFPERTGMDNPVNGIDLGAWSHPVFHDVDMDGDYDIVSGDRYNKIHYIKNNGGIFAHQAAMDNPFNVVSIPQGYNTAPAFADLDMDGDDDLFVGEYYGGIHYYENSGGVYIEQTGEANPFDGMFFGLVPDPSFIDIDDDGDLDFIVGDYFSERTNFYRNDEGEFNLKRGTSSPFEGLLGDLSAAPAFSDMDNDGDLDLLIGEKYGRLKYYEFSDEGFIPLEETFSFTGIADTIPIPVFADIDNDADEDLVVGTKNGLLRYFLKEGPNDFVEKTGTDNPFSEVDLGSNASPAFVDIDDDNDQDLFVGTSVEGYGRIFYYKNEEGVYTEQTGGDNPFNNINSLTDTIGGIINPVFEDIDADGDADLYIGSGEGILSYINNEGVFTDAGTENPFSGLDLGIQLQLYPAFADTDEDGDMDLFIGTMSKYGDGQVYFLENLSEPHINAMEPEISTNAVHIYSHEKTIVVDPGNEFIDRIEIYDLSGALIIVSEVHQNGKIEIELNELSDGLYLVRVFSEGIPSTGKVVIR